MGECNICCMGGMVLWGRKLAGFYVFTGRSARPTPFGDVIFLFYVFTCLTTNPTHSVGHIFLCLKKDMEERQTKGAAAPIGSPG